MCLPVIIVVIWTSILFCFPHLCLLRKKTVIVMVCFNWIFCSKTANYTIILSGVSVFPVTVSNGSWLNPLRRLNKINALDIQYVHLPRIIFFLIAPPTLGAFHNLRPQLRYRLIYMCTKSIIKAWNLHKRVD